MHKDLQICALCIVIDVFLLLFWCIYMCRYDNTVRAFTYFMCTCVTVFEFMSLYPIKGLHCKGNAGWSLATQKLGSESERAQKYTPCTWQCVRSTALYLLLSPGSETENEIERQRVREREGKVGASCSEWVGRSGREDSHVAHQTPHRPGEFRGGICNRIIHHRLSIQQLSMQQGASKAQRERE